MPETTPETVRVRLEPTFHAWAAPRMTGALIVVFVEVAAAFTMTPFAPMMRVPSPLPAAIVTLPVPEALLMNWRPVME